MKLNKVIRTRRQALGLTQEQLAQKLGVSAPAVNKWERNLNYPDVTLLPALARTLGVDLNTLLSFQEDLTAEEIARFTNNLDKMIREEGYEAAFQRGMDEIHQYPNCEALIYPVIFYLDGARFLHGVPNPDDYTDRLMSFYETMSHSQTLEIRDAALAMCIAYHRNRKDFARAEELINTIPSTRIDKEEQLATLYTQQEKREDAQRLWEHRILQSATELQTALIHLMEIAEQEDRPQDAQFCADTYQQVSSLLHVTKWIPYTAKFQLASLRQDRAACLSALRHILPVLKEPWAPQTCPLYRHMGDGDLTTLAQSLYDRIIDDLEHSEEFAFFRGSPEYEQLCPLLKEMSDSGK